MANPPLPTNKGFLKNKLQETNASLRHAGHPYLAKCVGLPLWLAEKSALHWSRLKRSSDKLLLLIRGRWLHFLQPHWTPSDIQAARSSRGAKENIQAFERQFQQLFQVPDHLVLSTSSGRTALELALRTLAAENPERLEVILPSYGCQATLLPILNCGLKPVFADMGPDLNLSLESVEPFLSEKTLAIIVVHLGGKYCEMLPEICLLAEERGCTVIEDACQATGGRNEDGNFWGTIAPISIFSFGLGKNLCATAGGLLLASSHREAILREAASLSEEPSGVAATRLEYLLAAHHGQGLARIAMAPLRPEKAFFSAYDYHQMHPIDALMMTRQLDQLDEILDARQKNAQQVLKAIEQIDALSVPAANGPNVWTKFSVQAASANAARHIQIYLQARGIETEAMYQPLHLSEQVSPFAKNPLPHCESAYRCIFNLPVRPSLKTKQIEYLVQTLLSIVESP